MSYTALYRKFRPDTFTEVKGQDHVVVTLQNQIRADRIGHAYLFTGTRGTGKTSAAKIFAKAVNCEHPVDGNPCGECPTCQAIASGRSLNVIEIDAASNNGVENIRQIRDEVSFSPAEGKFKVYIIDEVHMLSQGAFNALLKTLEEPPSYVIFILATTEVQKIPVTILSRCQRYDFRRISEQEITDRLADLLQREGVEADEKAVRYIARKADGGMRDALSLADQCISFYIGQRLTYEKVLDVLGAVDTEVLSKLLNAVVEGDVGACFTQIQDMLYAGREIGQFVSDFTWYLRDLMLLKASDKAEEILDVSEESMLLLIQDAAKIRDDTLMRYIRIFSELTNRMRYADNKRVLLEVAVVKMCRPQMEADVQSLQDRIRRLEKMLENGVVAAPQAAGRVPAPAVSAAAGAPSVEPAAAEVAEEPMRASFGKAAPKDLQQIKATWKSIVSGMSSHITYFALLSAKLRFDPEQEDRLIVEFTDFLGQGCVRAPEKPAAELEGLIADKIGKNVRVTFRLAADTDIANDRTQEIGLEEGLDRINMNIEIVDEA